MDIATPKRPSTGRPTWDLRRHNRKRGPRCCRDPRGDGMATRLRRTRETIYRVAALVMIGSPPFLVDCERMLGKTYFHRPAGACNGACDN